MIADLKTYPAMKPSGVEWLGEVPEHWQIVPNRALLRIKKELVGSNSDDYLLLSLTKRGVVARNMENPEGKFPTQFDSYQVIEPGNLIFCLFDIDETPRTVGLSSLHGMITGAYTRFVCADETARRFVYLLYVALDNGKHLKPLYTGLRKVITKSTFLSAKMPLPSPPEQAAIVRYLDHVDRRIRRYIHAKQKLITLLEEQKQAIIHQAVTRGLDPNVHLKPSGVEWLGEVPAHWEVRRLKSKLRPVDRRSSSGTETLLSLRRDFGVVVYGEHFSRPPQGVTLVGYKLVEAGQLVVNRLQANNGLLFCSRLSGVVSPDYSVFAARSPVDMEYLGNLLRTVTYKTHFRRESTGLGTGSAGFLRLYDDRLLETPVPLPPLEEQSTLLVSLSEITASLCRAIGRQHEEIDLLQEYRTRLIADVVTGKLDVREAAASLLEEADERDSLDEVVPLADDVVDNLYHRVGRGAGNGK